MKKFNLAFIPYNQKAKFINLSNKMPLNAAGYKLGDLSIPHITILQFFANDKNIDVIWSELISSIEEHVIELKFNEFSCITFDNINYWVSLLPNNIDKLNSIHQIAIDVIGVSKVRNYDPHLTLLNTLDSEFKNKVEPIIKEYNSISDDFILALGYCDEKGQFVQIRKQKGIH